MSILWPYLTTSQNKFRDLMGKAIFLKNKKINHFYLWKAYFGKRLDKIPKVIVIKSKIFIFSIVLVLYSPNEITWHKSITRPMSTYKQFLLFWFDSIDSPLFSTLLSLHQTRARRIKVGGPKVKVRQGNLQKEPDTLFGKPNHIRVIKHQAIPSPTACLIFFYLFSRK